MEEEEEEKERGAGGIHLPTIDARCVKVRHVQTRFTYACVYSSPWHWAR